MKTYYAPNPACNIQRGCTSQPEVDVVTISLTAQFVDRACFSHAIEYLLRIAAGDERVVRIQKMRKV